MVGVDALLQFRNQALADVPSDVGLNQEHFEFFKEVVIDRRALEELGDFAEHTPSSLLETLYELRIGFSAAAEEAVENHRVATPIEDNLEANEPPARS